MTAANLLKWSSKYSNDVVSAIYGPFLVAFVIISYPRLFSLHRSNQNCGSILVCPLFSSFEYDWIQCVLKAHTLTFNKNNNKIVDLSIFVKIIWMLKQKLLMTNKTRMYLNEFWCFCYFLLSKKCFSCSSFTFIGTGNALFIVQVYLQQLQIFIH